MLSILMLLADVVVESLEFTNDGKSGWDQADGKSGWDTARDGGKSGW